MQQQLTPMPSRDDRTNSADYIAVKMNSNPEKGIISPQDAMSGKSAPPLAKDKATDESLDVNRNSCSTEASSLQMHYQMQQFNKSEVLRTGGGMLQQMQIGGRSSNLHSNRPSSLFSSDPTKNDNNNGSQNSKGSDKSTHSNRMSMSRPMSLNLGTQADFDTVSCHSHVSTRHYCVKAPLEANVDETMMHAYLESIDIQQVNVPEQLKEEEKEHMLNSSKIKNSFKDMRLSKTGSDIFGASLGSSSRPSFGIMPLQIARKSSFNISPTKSMGKPVGPPSLKNMNDSAPGSMHKARTTRTTMAPPSLQSMASSGIASSGSNQSPFMRPMMVASAGLDTLKPDVLSLRKARTYSDVADCKLSSENLGNRSRVPGVNVEKRYHEIQTKDDVPTPLLQIPIGNMAKGLNSVKFVSFEEASEEPSTPLVKEEKLVYHINFEVEECKESDHAADLSPFTPHLPTPSSEDTPLKLLNDSRPLGITAVRRFDGEQIKMSETTPSLLDSLDIQPTLNKNKGSFQSFESIEEDQNKGSFNSGSFCGGDQEEKTPTTKTEDIFANSYKEIQVEEIEAKYELECETPTIKEEIHEEESTPDFSSNTGQHFKKRPLSRENSVDSPNGRWTKV